MFYVLSRPQSHLLHSLGHKWSSCPTDNQTYKLKIYPSYLLRYALHVTNSFPVITMHVWSLWLLSLLTLTMTASEPTSTAINIDWPTFMAAQDPVWKRLPTSYYEGPFVGNGLIGTVVFRDDQDTNALRFEIGRTDVWDHREGGSAVHERVRLPIGQLLFKPVGTITGVNLRTDLWNAEVTGSITTSKGTITLRCLAPSDSEVLIITMRCNGDEKNSTFSLRPQQGNSPRFLLQPNRDKNYTYKPNPPVRTEQIDGIEVAIQNLWAGSDYATAWHETNRPDGSRLVVVSTANRWAINKESSGQPLTGSAVDAVATVRITEKTDLERLISNHRDWWHRYYSASFLSVPDARLESFYWIQLYKMASATRQDRPVVDLMGPWFKPSVWSAYWINLNLQLSYYTADVTNHPELFDALNQLISRRRDDLVANVPDQFRADCAGMGMITGYDSLRAPYKIAVNNDKVAMSYIQLPWLLQLGWVHYRSTIDEKSLREVIYPLMRRTGNVFLHTLVENADHQLSIPYSFSDEYGSAKHTSLSIALARWNFETLITAAQVLKIDDPLLPRWRDALARMAEYPIDPATGIMIGTDAPFAKPHRHSSHLFAIYPLHLMNSERTPDRLPLIEQSLTHFTALDGDNCMFKFTGASSLWSEIGRGDESIRWLRRSLEILPYSKPTVGPNTLYSENGWPTFESPISAARCMTDLLLQSWGNCIRVFPALPSEWKNVSFHHLRAEGAFLVSAQRRQGKTQQIRITSLAGEPCHLRCDFPTPIHILGRTDQLMPDATGMVTVPVEKGQEVVLVPAGITAVDPITSVAHPAGATWGMP